MRVKTPHHHLFGQRIGSSVGFVQVDAEGIVAGLSAQQAEHFGRLGWQVLPEPAAAPEPEPVAAPEPVPVAAPEPVPVAAPEPVPVAAPEPEPVASLDREALVARAKALGLKIGSHQTATIARMVAEAEAATEAATQGGSV